MQEWGLKYKENPKKKFHHTSIMIWNPNKISWNQKKKKKKILIIDNQIGLGLNSTTLESNQNASSDSRPKN